MLIDFMNTHYSDQLHEKLSSKVDIIKENIELLQRFLGRWQAALNYNYKNVKYETLIDILYKQMPFSGTRFELYAFTFKNLMKETSPEDIFKLFLNQNKVYSLQWNNKKVGSKDELYYIIELIGLTRAWTNANKDIFGTSPQPQII